MKKNNRASSLLARYTSMLKKNPKSRVFAPLAETYRKIGLYEKAFTVLNNGRKHHPDYLLGKIVEANCLYDTDKFEDAYHLLKSELSKNFENIILHKTYVKICESLELKEDALASLKALLLLNPKDMAVASKVHKLEKELETESRLDDNKVKEETDEDDWVQVSFVNNEKLTEDTSVYDWNVSTEAKLENFKNSVASNDMSLDIPSIDDEYYFQEFDNEEPEDDETEEVAPVVTETLIDLYLKQNQNEKALQVIEKVLEENPENTELIEKKRAILGENNEDNLYSSIEEHYLNYKDLLKNRFQHS